MPSSNVSYRQNKSWEHFSVYFLMSQELHFYVPVSTLPRASINAWKMSRRARLHRKWECHVLCYFFECDSGSKYSSNRNLLCFPSQNGLEKTVSTWNWDRAEVPANILDSQSLMSTPALSLNVFCVVYINCMQELVELNKLNSIPFRSRWLCLLLCLLSQTDTPPFLN